MSDIPREEQREPRLPEGYALNCPDEDGPMTLAREDDGRVIAVFPALARAEEIEALAWELVEGTSPGDKTAPLFYQASRILCGKVSAEERNSRRRWS
jgi:hypothetical protein